jgi:hypothetical protein
MYTINKITSLNIFSFYIEQTTLGTDILILLIKQNILFV